MKMTRAIKNIFVSILGLLLFIFTSIAVASLSIFDVKAETLTTSVMYTVGASIRLAKDGRNGIRFHVRVNSNEDGSVIFGEYEYTKEEFLNAQKGILVIPNDKLSDGETLTIEGAKKPYASGAKAANPSDLAWILKYDSGNYFYESTAYVYNIPETSYDREFLFRGRALGRSFQGI